VTFEADLYPDEYYDGLHQGHALRGDRPQWARAGPRHPEARARSAFVPTADAVLDLGSARGDVCFLLAPRVRKASRDRRVAARPRARERSARRSAARERALRARRTWRTLDAAPGSSIDVAGAFDLLEHVDDGTVRRMLRRCAAFSSRRRFVALHAQPRALRRALKARDPS
jgi:hypothetical protein